ncbi:MAG TPA: 4a-hydroxytetrahydrobiopterin dehydratase [Povalibacter sp.]|uniref:4a-hydroxytetrahydrobiopterin dehydratase n=1 Tax=Povalibacter sp. TaxID=1962978 RepID=UPI002CC904E9|nr:4a-hydroxytetrahydrobiopterin dehydratase [Povalibacter sp.]HMN47268.1 4a-hydroxytetrahydrobiopterin dehydratase [Povalibacter sp.]
MSDLASKKCVPCEGGTAPMGRAEAESLLKQLQPEWRLADDAKSLHREWKFKNFYRTMSFVNAVAHVANTEDHHPDLEVGYGYCRLKYSTHAIDGLSENDFICAAKIDALPVQ